MGINQSKQQRQQKTIKTLHFLSPLNFLNVSCRRYRKVTSRPYAAYCAHVCQIWLPKLAAKNGCTELLNLLSLEVFWGLAMFDGVIGTLGVSLKVETQKPRIAARLDMFFLKVLEVLLMYQLVMNAGHQFLWYAQLICQRIEV